MLDYFLVENISPKVACDFLIQRFGTLRVVIPNQEHVGRLLNYHQGIFVGNGVGLRTIWTLSLSVGVQTLCICLILMLVEKLLGDV